MRELISSKPAYDKDPSGIGPFGLCETNPIPVNGPIGELAYLSSLEADRGERILFHRLGALGTIDVFEAVTFSGNEWYLFYLDFYHPRKSRLAPQGFRFASGLAQFSGFHKRCADFPNDFVDMKQSERESGLSIAYIAISKVAQQISDGMYRRPESHMRKVQLVEGRFSSSMTQ